MDTDVPKVWMIAMFNDAGEFVKKELVNDANIELAIELNKKELDKDRIIKLAIPYLGLNLKKSKLLSPLSAVRMVWTSTGKFSEFEHARVSGDLTGIKFEVIKDKADAGNDENEKRYIHKAYEIMNVSYRNLHIVYKKREQNFAENKLLIDSCRKAVEESLAFGTKAQDLIKSAPRNFNWCGSGYIYEYKVIYS